MKIAYIVPYVPNLVRIRSYNLINHLIALGNEVVVFTLGSGDYDRKDAAALRSKVTALYYQEQPVWYSLWNSAKALPSKQPLQTVYSWNKVFADKIVNHISDKLNGFDVVHVEHLRGSKYGQYIRTHIPTMPVVWDSVDCISYLFKQASTHNKGGFGRYVTRFELGRTAKAEGKLVGEFDHVLVTSETDRKALLELVQSDLRRSFLTVLSNGVDLGYFHPNPSIQKDSASLVFSGKMSYHANVSMVKFLVSKIMPLVWVQHPNARLTIVGKDPTADVSALGEDSRITVTGTVDDIRPYLWKATCAVVPLVYGAGIQNKILEAMACGVPVVTTPNALSPLGITPGEELLVGENSASFSDCVNRLLYDRKLQAELGTKGASYVTRYHNWRDMTNQLVTCYENVIKGKVHNNIIKPRPAHRC